MDSQERFENMIGLLEAHQYEWAIWQAAERATQMGWTPPSEAQPVAWRYFDGEGNYEYRDEPPSESSVYHAAIYGRKFEPLYLAAPTPERAQESAGVRLTDAQILEIADRYATVEGDEVVEFARAVIATNKETQ